MISNVTGIETLPAEEFTVSVVVKYPGLRLLGSAVTVIDVPGPAVMEEGVPETESQLSPVLMDVTSIVPPPVFCRLTLCEDAAGFELKALNERMPLLTVSSGGGAETVKLTLMVCTLPAQGLPAAQAMEIVVE